VTLGALTQVLVLAAVVLIVVHRWVTNRWLEVHTQRHGRLPGRDWWRERDPDSAVERWRRLRLVVLIPTVGAFASAVTLLISGR
jgi:hypothetical protein